MAGLPSCSRRLQSTLHVACGGPRTERMNGNRISHSTVVGGKCKNMARGVLFAECSARF